MRKWLEANLIYIAFIVMTGTAILLSLENMQLTEDSNKWFKAYIQCLGR